MHNFLQDKLKRDGLFLFLLIHTAIILTMESPRNIRSLSPTTELPLKPDHIIQALYPEKESKKTILRNELIPKNILITPDGKGLIMIKRGKVESFLFDDPSNLNIIIEHPKAKKNFPMVAMSQNKDGLLTIISASNYNKVNTDYVAEYTLFFDEWATSKKLDKLIQAISLDAYGTMLAIAHKRSVVIIDLKNNYTSEETFKGIGNTDHCIVDVAFNPIGRALVAVGSQGSIQLMNVLEENGHLRLAFTKQVIIRDDVIKKIYYPNCDELLYITEKGNVKTIAIKDGLLEPDNEDAKTTDFVKGSFYNQIEGDRYNIATVHWNNTVPMVKDSPSAIEVYCKRNNEIKKFILEIPLLGESYCHITDCGQYAVAKGHLLCATLTGKYIGALATDGNIRIWVLPESNIINHDNDKKYEKLESECIVLAKDKETKKIKQKRGRSESDKANKHSLTSSDGVETGDKKKVFPRSEKDNKHGLMSNDGVDTGEKKKVSPRVLDIFKGSGGGNQTSQEASPQRGRSVEGKK